MNIPNLAARHHLNLRIWSSVGGPGIGSRPPAILATGRGGGICANPFAPIESKEAPALNNISRRFTRYGLITCLFLCDAPCNAQWTCVEFFKGKQARGAARSNSVSYMKTVWAVSPG